MPSLCTACTSIPFSLAVCSPEHGHAVHHAKYSDLLTSATKGCPLCCLIRDKPRENQGGWPPTADEEIRCNIWNWYEGPRDLFKGSANIVWSSSTRNWSVNVGVWVEEDSAAARANIISGRKAKAIANSQDCYLKAKEWIGHCLLGHGLSCPYDAEANLPTRLIDVGEDELSRPHLHVTNKGEKGVWVALSHCWGRVAKFVTETTNITERQTGMEIGDLPKTFADAIIATRRLGYRYLWIDSLCILQDSIEDWRQESQCMKEYYSKAILTIASDVATGDHEGFLERARDEVDSIKIPFNFSSEISAESSNVFVTENSEYAGKKHDSTHLSQRAWTLQEDILSPRTLHYTATQLVFECQRVRLIELDATPRGFNDAEQMRSVKRFFLRPESGLDDPLYPGYEVFYKPIARWYNLFEEYCQRILTFEKDRLAALAGIAQEVQCQTSFTYRAGIWMEDMHLGLLWCVGGRGQKPNEYRAPSWSWAALDIQYYWGHNINPNFQLYYHRGTGERSIDDGDKDAVLIDCRMDAAGGDEQFGQLFGGRLRLRGYCLACTMWNGESAPHRNTYWRTIRSHQWDSVTYAGFRPAKAKDQIIYDFDEIVEDIMSESESDIAISNDADKNWNESQISTEEKEEDECEEEAFDDDETDDSDDNWDTAILNNLFLFRIATYRRISINTGKVVCYALILTPVEDGNNTNNLTFRRVGLAEVPKTDNFESNDWLLKDITII